MTVKLKRMIAFVLSLSMIFSLFTVQASAVTVGTGSFQVTNAPDDNLQVDDIWTVKTNNATGEGVIVTSGDEEVATVEGVAVTAVSEGDVTITVTRGADKVEVKLKVVAADESGALLELGASWTASSKYNDATGEDVDAGVELTYRALATETPEDIAYEWSSDSKFIAVAAKGTSNPNTGVVTVSAATPTGDYEVYVKISADGYKSETLTAYISVTEIEIVTVEVTLTPVGEVKEYTGAVVAIDGFTSDVEDFVPVIGENVEVVYDETPVEIGTYDYSYEIVDTTGVYYGSGESALEITKAKVEVEATSDLSYVYGNQFALADVDFSADFEEGAVVEVTSPADAADYPKNVGEYTAEISITSDHYVYGSYVGDEFVEGVTVSYEITQKEYLVVTPNEVVTYYHHDDLNSLLDYKMAGFEYDDNRQSISPKPATLYTDAVETSEFGVYSIYYGDPSVTESQNYKFDLQATSTLSITEKQQTDGIEFVSGNTTAEIGDEFVTAVDLSVLGNAVTFISSNPAVATITNDGDDQGFVKVVGQGKTAIVATDADGNEAWYTLTVGSETAVLDESNTVQTYDGTVKAITVKPVNEDDNIDMSKITFTYTQNGVEVEPINAGTYDVTYSIDDDTYKGTYTTTMTIEKANFSGNSGIGIEINGSTFVYGDAVSAYGTVADGSVYQTNGVVFESVSNYAADGAYESATAPRNVGSYMVSATFTSMNYNDLTTSEYFTITPASLVITADDKPISYGSEIGDLAVKSYVGFQYGEDESVLTSPVVVTTVAEKGSDVGTYPTVASGAAADNYTISYEDGTLTINEAGTDYFYVTSTATTFKVDDSFTLVAYVNNEIATEVEWKIVAGSDVVSYADGVYTVIAAGDFAIEATYTGTNYDVDSFTFEGTATTTESNLSIVENTFVYSGSPVAVEWSSNMVGVEYADVTTTYYDADGVVVAAPTNAGTYKAVYVINDAAYAGSTGSAFFTIAKAEYGVNEYGDKVTLITQVGFAILGNTYVDGELTSGDGAVTYGDYSGVTNITWEGFFKNVYSVASTTYAASNGGDVPLDGSAPTAVGTYQATVTLTSDNYVDFSYTVDYEITPASLTVTPAAEPISYGSIPTYTVSYSGFEYGEDESVLTAYAVATSEEAAAAGYAVGTYEITASGATAQNYAISYETGTLTINAKDLDDNDFVMYIVGSYDKVNVGDAFQANAVIDTNIVFADWTSSDESVATVVDGYVTALSTGTTVITATLADERYASETAVVSFVLTVNKDTVTLEAVQTEFVYNGFEQGLKFQVANDVMNETVAPEYMTINYYTASGMEEAVPRDAGIYYVEYSMDAGVIVASGTMRMVIEKADVELNVVDETKVYGDSNPDFFFEGLLGEDAYDFAGDPNYYAMYADMFTLTTDADEYSDVGVYDIVMAYVDPHTATSSNNYNFTNINDGTLTIVQKELTFEVLELMTEDGITYPVDAPYEITGFVNDQDMSVLLVDENNPLTFVYTGIDETTTPGLYEDVITATGGYLVDNGNYFIGGYTAGDLKIVDFLVNVVAGSASTSTLEVIMDQDIDLSVVDFTVTDASGATVAISGVTKDGTTSTYYISGSFVSGATYTVTMTDNGTGVWGGYDYGFVPEELSFTVRASSSSSGSSSGGGGGGSSSSSSGDYDITVDVSNGDVDLSEDDADKDDEITFTVTVDDGYELVDITVTEDDDDADDVDFEYDEDEDEYSFTMPASDVLITVTTSAVFENETPFEDVDVDDDNYAGIAYVYLNGIMAGISDTEFGGEMSITRGMITAILYRLNGSVPADETVEMPFTDVAETAYYYEAIRWAKEVGVVAGYDETTFAPDQTISNEQFAALMYRYATFKGMETAVDADANLDDYRDADEITAYAYAALLWACEYGVMGDSSKLYPTDYAIREEVATSLMNFMEMEAAVETEEVEAEEEVVEEEVVEEEI